MKRPGLMFLVATLAMLAAVFGVRRGPDPALWPARPGEPAVTVYVVDNGFHSNVVVERARLAARPGPTARALATVSPSPWVAVGWGDRRFFTESGVSVGRALDGLRALFAPGNRSVTMLEPLSASPDRLYRDGVVRLTVSAPGFERLAQRIDRSFALRDGAPVAGPRGPVANARFFESGETFGLFRLCNHWTSDLLHAAGVPTRPVLDTLGWGMALDLRTWAVQEPSP